MANNKRIRTNVEIDNNVSVGNDLSVAGDFNLTGDIVKTGALRSDFEYTVSNVVIVNNSTNSDIFPAAVDDNFVTLSPGVWEVHGGLSMQGGGITYCALMWATEQADDSGLSLAPDFALEVGNTLQASSAPPITLNGGDRYIGFEYNGGAVDTNSELAPLLRLNITVPQIIYLLPYAQSTSGTDTEVRVSIYAKRI